MCNGLQSYGQQLPRKPLRQAYLYILTINKQIEPDITRINKSKVLAKVSSLREMENKL